MTDKLTEVLARVDRQYGPSLADLELLIDVAERWRDFPTDDDVRRGAAAECGSGNPCEKHLRRARTVLEAVKEDR